MILARAAMAAGLHVARRGSYPVTVGVGFSTAELILSADPILYPGVQEPDAVVITSEDGLSHQQDRIRGMRRGILWLEASLSVPETGAEVRLRRFREPAGARYAALYALGVVLQETGILPLEALQEAIRESPLGSQFPLHLLPRGNGGSGG